MATQHNAQPRTVIVKMRRGRFNGKARRNLQRERSKQTHPNPTETSSYEFDYPMENLAAAMLKTGDENEDRDRSAADAVDIALHNLFN